MIDGGIKMKEILQVKDIEKYYGNKGNVQKLLITLVLM